MCKGPREATEVSRGHARPQSGPWPVAPALMWERGRALSGRQQSGVNSLPQDLWNAVICGPLMGCSSIKAEEPCGWSRLSFRLVVVNIS